MEKSGNYLNLEQAIENKRAEIKDAVHEFHSLQDRMNYLGGLIMRLVEQRVEMEAELREQPPNPLAAHLLEHDFVPPEERV